MAPKLNRGITFVVVFILNVTFLLAQDDQRSGDKDYKNKEQFERFLKRRKVVGAWQINQLRTGALVVRLKTNKILINALLKQGDIVSAREKQFEMKCININIMRAFRYNYDFSKVYFIYSSSSDSLLKGIRNNIFLDSNLMIDPSIKMNEKFYLLAERDNAYNSSIGFVKEDTAKNLKENGYSIKEMAIVVKNKYGHQLKKPFPYLAGDRPVFIPNESLVFKMTIDRLLVPINISKGTLFAKRKPLLATKRNKDATSFLYEGNRLILYVPKRLTYARLALSIGNFNEELKRFYRASPDFTDDKISEDVKPFLY
jgi:hypothetical protein